MLNLENIKNLQKELSSLLGVSGYEDEVSNFILKMIEEKNLADKVWKDKLGNILVIKEGKVGKERILFDAHIDEIGFMVSHIDKKGFLRFVPVGGWDTRILLGQAIIIKSESGKIYHGLIGSKPPHLTSINERKKVVDIPDMYIDIGMTSLEAVEKAGIHIGTIGTLYVPFQELPNNFIRGKAFDDRTGCNVLLHLLMEVKDVEIQDTLLFNFAVQEEFGRIGTGPGAYTLNPSMAIAVENTTAADVPGIKSSENPAILRDGPAITIADKSIISSKYVNKRLTENANKEGIKYQFKRPMYGLTDAGIIQESREGIPSTVVSVPCRYIHSPTSLLNLEDIQNTIKLLIAFVKNSANI
ncbi:MAG: M42 family peptidase [Candidatus Lokiarchaeota archaeon]|nr:M42 family peptidase [Candidatus Lokiarchaeota archaeon]